MIVFPLIKFPEVTAAVLVTKACVDDIAPPFNKFTPTAAEPLL